VEGKLRVLRYLPTRISLGQRPWLIHAVTYVLTQSWFAARLPGLVRCRGASLVHFHTRYGGGPFYTSLKRCGVPVIADLHDKMTAPRELTGVADRLLSCGEGVRRFAVDGGFPANRVILIPIPFEPPPMPSPAQVGAARQRYGLGADRYLLFVGDITHNKGVYELLEGFRLWRSKHPEVRLVLAGTNREGERFLGQIGDRSEATYLGHIPHRDVLPLMRGAEVLVLPSRSEGLPRVILEALAVGTRVLCPPGIPEFERYLSHWVLPRVHADDIAEMLEPIWRDPQIPSYPFSEHRLDLVVEALAGIYGEVVTGESH
jgi:glycosyltransferase involved in cell wall biosynthesis